MPLTTSEIETITTLLGRSPSEVELTIFDTMWSEHCSYKSSKPVLKTLPTDGPNIMLGVGEDSGIIECAQHDGVRYGIAVSHESHNHPSQVLPIEGAATGVGGVVRDVYCMGADVIGVLDSLHFGISNSSQYSIINHIAQNVVRGVADYGNPLGVPNVGGETIYHDSYNENCLVNVAAIGLVKEDDIIRSKVPKEAKQIPYSMILIGKTTDSTGFGGASFSSTILDSEDDVQNLGAVQVHDPFMKRVLVVAIQDMLTYVKNQKIAIGFKDLGAGGIACASSELAVAGGFGCELNLNQVPVIDDALKPEVIACSETQERFCVVVPDDHAQAICDIFNKQHDMGSLYPGAGAAVIGMVIQEPQYRIKYNNEIICDLPVSAITTEVLADRQTNTREIKRTTDALPSSLDIEKVALQINQHLNAAQKKYVYRNFDQFVKGNSVVIPGEADACVLAPIQDCQAGVAVTIDSNTYGATDPYVAGAYAVAESIRNIIAVGAEPIALTDCLNYGNPENPDVFFDFQEGVRGIGDAAKALSPNDVVIPIISGNVSFYNESKTGQAIVPSPVICCIGKMQNADAAHRMQFSNNDAHIMVIGAPKSEFSDTILASIVEGSFHTTPQVQMNEELAMNKAMFNINQKQLSQAVHDISQGGIWQTIVEMIVGDRNWPFVGVHLNIPAEFEPATLLFSESGGYVCEVPKQNRSAFIDICKQYQAPFFDLGITTESLNIEVKTNNETLISQSVNSVMQAWNHKNIETPGTPIYNDAVKKDKK